VLGSDGNGDDGAREKQVTSRKPSAGFWIAVALVAVLAYPISFGPACWISERTVVGSRAISIAYQPMLRLWMQTDFPGRAIAWYATIGTSDGSHAINTVDGGLVLSWASE